MSDRSDETEIEPSDRMSADPTDGFAAYLEKNGVTYGTSCLSCQGPDPDFARIGRLAAFLLGSTIDGRPAVVDVVVAAAPGSIQEEVQGLVLKGMDAAMSRHRGIGLKPEEYAAIAKRLSVRVPRDRRPASLVEIVEATGRGMAVIAVDVAEYRSPGIRAFAVDATADPSLPEDTWVPHLAETARQVMAAVRRTDALVVLEAGTMAPHRLELEAMLSAIDDDCGVILARAEDDPMEFVAAHADRWIDKLKEGRLGVVLREIDASPLPPADKHLIKAQSLHRSGLYGHAVEAVDALLRHSGQPSAHTAIALAKIAADGGALSLGARLLSPAIGDSLSREELEMALVVAEEVEDDAIADKAAAKLQALFGESPLVWKRRLAAFNAAKDFASAASELEARGAPEGEIEYYRIIDEALTGPGIPDYPSVLARLSKLGAEQGKAGRIACVRDAAARRLPHHSRSLAPKIEPTYGSIGFALEVLENTLSAQRDGKLVVPYEDVRDDIAEVVSYLSERPIDFITHAKLSRVLASGVAGKLGLALIASVVLESGKRSIEVIRGERTSKADLRWLDVHADLFEPVAAWLHGEAPTVMGQARLPRELIGDFADDMMAALVDGLQALAVTAGEDKVEELIFLASAAVAVAPHTSDPHRDLEVMRFLACRLVANGHVQQARDVCHQIFLNADGSRTRARAAWYASADIHHRTGDLLEATLAMACAMATDEPMDERRAWLETVCLVRILRDLNLKKQALSTLAIAKSAFTGFAFAKANKHRLDVLELQIEQSSLDDATDVAAALSDLLLKAVELAKRAEALHDEDVGPLAVLLGELSRKATVLGLAIPAQTAVVLGQLESRGGETVAALVRAVSARHPTAADVAEQAARLQPSRYAEDAGFGARASVLLAGRLLSSEAALADPETAVYAIERLADSGTAAPGWRPAVAPARSATELREPAAFAKKLSRSGVAIALAGFDDSGRLVLVFAIDGELSVPRRASVDTITLERVQTWGRDLPFDYGIEDETSNLFFTSTEGFVIDELGNQPTIIVADTRFQAFPPNIFRKKERFLGSVVPLASAPSLAWLSAAREASDFGRDGREVAWIATDGEPGTLASVAGWLEYRLDTRSVVLTTTNTVPLGFANADLAVVVAHGQTISKNDFFQSIADDAFWRVAGDSFADALRNIGVCILFVCSGGRMDRHPTSNTMLGLAKALLNRGCSAVVAAPWPIDPRIAVSWLPAFFEAWDAGKRLIEANFLANAAVAKAYPRENAKAIAMTVYGDALMTKTGWNPKD